MVVGFRPPWEDSYCYKGMKNKSMSICEPESELSPDTRCAGTLILDFPPSRAKKWMLFKLPWLWWVFYSKIRHGLSTGSMVDVWNTAPRDCRIHILVRHTGNIISDHMLGHASSFRRFKRIEIWKFALWTQWDLD